MSSSDKVLQSLENYSADKILEILPQNTIDILMKTYLEKQMKKEYPIVLYLRPKKLSSIDTFIKFYTKVERIFQEISKLDLQQQLILSEKIDIRNLRAGFIELSETLSPVNKDLLQKFYQKENKNFTYKDISVLILLVLNSVKSLNEEDLEDIMDNIDDYIEGGWHDIFSICFNIQQSTIFLKILDKIGVIDGIHLRDLFVIENIPKYSYCILTYDSEKVHNYKITKNINTLNVSVWHNRATNIYTYLNNNLITSSNTDPDNSIDTTIDTYVYQCK